MPILQPTASVTTDREREFEFTDENFQHLRTRVRELTGITLSDAKRELVYSRLSRRLRRLAVNDFNTYCQLLEREDGNNELSEFINAITTNLTYFFREEHHFDYLGQVVLPELIERNRDTQRIRIWSAGCSTGEEPYSLAITVKEHLPAEAAGWDVKILATDLDSNVLEHARAGVYATERIESLSQDRLRRWFSRGSGSKSGFVKVNPALQTLITFKQLNLMGSWPMHGPLDLIVCRNVVIYFDKDTQRVLFDRYADLLAKDGHLFVGHSESLFKVSERFELIGKSMYRKCR